MLMGQSKRGTMGHGVIPPYNFGGYPIFLIPEKPGVPLIIDQNEKIILLHTILNDS